MKYTQHNPLPIPDIGPTEPVDVTMTSIFDWEYALHRENLLALYEKGKANTWNASDLDWSVDVNLEKIQRDYMGMGAQDVFNQMLNPPRPLDQNEAIDLNLNINAWMLSQFLHGEQGALLATAKIVQGVPWEEAKWYAANQVADEARHVEVYHRYLTEKLGLSYEISPSLNRLLDDIIEDPRWDVTFLGMQIMVEGLALAAFGVVRMQMADEPLIQDLITRVMGDESRHVAFGVLSLADLYRTGMTSTELREREDFVIEATHMLRDRLVPSPVFERLGWDVKTWTDWSNSTPFMRGFRQMMFTKIVPNLKRLGLLTPRVRAAYEKLDLLQFEHHKESVEEPEAPPPQELVQILELFLKGTGSNGAAANGA